MSCAPGDHWLIADICHSRYNDKLWSTVRIKNWNSCIPEELRQTDFMAVVNYERQIEPEVVSSPFHRGITGPGFFGEPKGKATEEDDEETAPARSVATMPTPARPTPRPAPIPAPVATPAPRPAPSQPLPTPTPVPVQNPSHPMQHRPPISGWTSTPTAPPSARSLGTIFGGSQILDQVAQKDMLPPDTGELLAE